MPFLHYFYDNIDVFRRKTSNFAQNFEYVLETTYNQ